MAPLLIGAAGSRVVAVVVATPVAAVTTAAVGTMAVVAVVGNTLVVETEAMIGPLAEISISSDWERIPGCGFCVVGRFSA